MKNYVFSLKLSSTKIHVIPVIASCIEEAIHEADPDFPYSSYIPEIKA